MNAVETLRTDRTVRTATWLYVAPRAVIAILILSTIGLAAFLVFLSLVINIPHHLGA